MKPYEKYKDSGVAWIGVVPEHWEVKRLKYSTSINDEVLPETTEKDAQIEYIEIADVQAGQGIVSSTSYRFENAPSRARRVVRTGDIIVSTVRTYLKAIAKIRNPVENLIVSTGFAVIRPQTVNSDFLGNVFFSENLLGEIISKSTGVSYPAISSSEIGNIKIPIPPLPDQTAIARYLDQKTVEIDQLIAQKERLLALWEEEKTALISQAVTRGLDAGAKMKDTGVAWLGEVPEHWVFSKIGFISKVVRGASPRPAGDLRYFNGNHTPWITVAELTKDSNKYLDSVLEYLTEEGATQSRFVDVGTLLMSNSGATLGVPKILNIGGCINDGSVAFLNLNPKISIDFLYHFLASLTFTFRDLMKGSGQPNLNTDIVKSTVFCYPELPEQTAIVRHIENQTAHIQQQMNQTRKLIELLKAYRATLISEVVTGKINVTQ